MKFSCDTVHFCEAIANVMKAVSSKSTLPILEGICIIASGDQLTLTGYDLEIGITTQVEATISEPGSVVLAASYLYNIARKMPGDRIVVCTDEKQKTTIESGITSFHILGMSAEEYPQMPEVSIDELFSVSRKVLKNMIDMTLFAVAAPDTPRPIQMGSLFDISEGVFRLVSVDGFRLAMRQEKIENQNLACEFVVPGKTLGEISRLIDSAKDRDKKAEDDKEPEVLICFTEKHALFEIGSYTIITRLLEGEFLNYQRSIPETGQLQVDVSVRDFIDSIERVSLLITERLKSPLRCLFKDNTIALSCVTTVGRSYDEVPCKTEGEIVDIGFNNRYLLDALKASGCTNVKLELSSPPSPMKILPMEGEDFLYLVLPTRLKNDLG